MLLKSLMTGDIHSRFGGRAVFKGGGGGSQTTTSGIDEEFKPYLERVLKDVTNRYEGEVAQGPDAIVAGLTKEQKAAMRAQKAQAKDMMAGTGLYDTRAAEARSLQDLAGSSAGQAYSGGVLGSARSQAATQGALAGRAGEYQQERQRVADLGAKNLGDVGSAKQAYEQARLDAPHTSASRYFGYLAGAPQTTKTTSSGGGK